MTTKKLKDLCLDNNIVTDGDIQSIRLSDLQELSNDVYDKEQVYNKQEIQQISSDISSNTELQIKSYTIKDILGSGNIKLDNLRFFKIKAHFESREETLDFYALSVYTPIEYTIKIDDECQITNTDKLQYSLDGDNYVDFTDNPKGLTIKTTNNKFYIKNKENNYKTNLRYYKDDIRYEETFEDLIEITLDNNIRIDILKTQKR